MANTLFFTNEQGKSIIVTESLFSMDSTQSEDTHAVYMDLKELLEKDKKLELHAINLSDYWREEMIPRGLRIVKFPSFGKDNMEFKSKWEAILNKCSLDLILLLIEESKKQRAEIQETIRETKEKLSKIVSNSKEMEEQERKLSEDVNKLAQEIAKEKIRNFKRDKQDYSNGSVYFWTKRPRRESRPGRPGQPGRMRSVSFSLPSSATTSEDESLNPRNMDQDFLSTRKAAKPKGRRRGRDVEDLNGDGPPGHTLRPLTQHRVRNWRQ